MYTLTKFNEDATNAIYEGVKEVTEAVATTLGPRGRNVLIDKGYETSVIHDGVNVSLVINPKDPFKRNGAKLIQEATKKQRDSVGDGTTAVCVLTQAIVDEAKKVIASGTNAMELRQGLESGSKKVVEMLQTISKPVKTSQQKTQIATISAEDAELGELVVDAVEKVGDEGVLTVEESKARETYIEHQEGMQIEKGYTHPFMITDPERQLAVMEDAHVLITDHNLMSVAEIGRFLENVVFPNTKKVLFIAPEIGTDFMQVLLGAKIQGAFLGLAMRAPGIGSMQTEMMLDICALTGATLVTKEANMKFDEQQFSVLGKANKIVMSKISTIITGGSGHKQDIVRRIAIIRKQMEDVDLSEYDREQLRGRLAKLTNGVGVIKVGGETEVEMKERKERVIDAVSSVQSAIKYGMVAGGEISYLRCLDVLDDAVIGERILKQALRQPFVRLVENAGMVSGEMLEKLRTAREGVGVDVTDGELKDMVASGIIDSAGVPITAVKTAVSVAVQLVTMGAAIVIDNQDENHKMP